MTRPARAPSKRLSAIGIAFFLFSAARHAADERYDRAVVFLTLAGLFAFVATRPPAYFEWARRKPLRERLVGLAVVLPILVASVLIGGVLRFAPVVIVCLLTWWDHRRFRAYERAATADDPAQAIQR